MIYLSFFSCSAVLVVAEVKYEDVLGSGPVLRHTEKFSFVPVFHDNETKLRNLFREIVDPFFIICSASSGRDRNKI